ncbi:hypothetical protein ILUMI_14445 [Ignelater luminosus]|uniref:Tc1-like transposase DDE domain-containing protein n=1 Tax=Ignelater luminosus TaxID=2038154 RepID=A0A8K0CQF4_IGNLU|nr:hypothetical protein ILUMI_14445 [Ignelater luminosus]
MNNSKMIHSQGRELIYGVYQFMKKEKEEGEPVIFLSNLREKVAAGTGVSLSTVKRIIKKGKNKPERATFSSPRKTIEKPSPKSDLDQFDEEIIRTVIYRFTKTHQCRPTLPKILEAVKNERVDFTRKLSIFRKIIIRLGFRWRKTEDRRKILLENPETGKSGDFHDKMNHNFMKWLSEQVIPNLPQNLVLVLDNASYHNVVVNPAPTLSCKKAVMQQWLNKRNISFNLDKTKVELYEKIKIHKPQYCLYAVDNLLAKHGHTVLRLLPYHPVLNPIEKIWALIKNRVAARNTTFRLNDVRSLVVEEFNAVTVEDWQKVCAHVMEIEEKFMSQERII